MRNKTIPEKTISSDETMNTLGSLQFRKIGNFQETKLNRFTLNISRLPAFLSLFK